MKRFGFVVLLMSMLLATPAWAAKIQVGEDGYVNLQYLLQSWGSFGEKDAPNKDAWGKDFYVRRSRILVHGAVNKFVSFFMDTDQVNWGKKGDFTSSPFYVQDAFVSFNFMDELKVDTGMILVPFTRHGIQGAVALHTLEYHGDLLKFPVGKTWRDTGVQVRGLALGGLLHYRVGAFQGVEAGAVAEVKDASGKVTTAAMSAKNETDLPRVTGHARVNIMGKEEGFFLQGIYFAKEPMISVGAGVDWQKNGTFKLENGLPKAADYLAFAGDFFVDWPLAGGEQEIIAQGQFAKWNNGEKAATSGTSMMGEVGYRYDKWNPNLSFEQFASDADKSDFQAMRVGLNYWIEKHTANLKADFSLTKKGDLSTVDAMKMIRLQAQLFF